VAPRAALIGLFRLVHPFPSLLTATATATIASLAGAAPPTALRLGVAMLAMQCSIGAVNDLVDAPLDAGQKPRKPIPLGVVSPRAAVGVAATGALLGVVLSAVSGPATAAAALLGLGLGYAYDLRLSRTIVSWLPLSLALPLLPIHAWLGAANAVADGLLTLVPAAVLGGAGLAIANGIVDVDRDASAGRTAVAVALGRERAWIVQTLALGAAVALAVTLAPMPSRGAGGLGAADLLRALRLGGIALGVVAIALGAAVLRASRPGIRERGWELEAIGTAALGIGWLAGTTGAASGGGGA
jgi:4-hydroxybenzoate polyprenyltransferase